MMSHRDAPPEAPAFRVRTLTTVRHLEQSADEWHELWKRCEGARTPYLSFEWVRTWAEHYVPDGWLHVLVVEHEGRVVGIMPLMRHRYGVGPFAVFALETVGRESRNLIALVDPRLTETVIDALAQHLRGRIGAQGLVLHLTLVPSEHPTLHQFVSRLASKRPTIATCLLQSSVAPYVPLPATLSEFARSLGRRRRKVLGSAGKRLGQAYPDMCVRWVHGAETADAMEELFCLHETRWNSAGMRGLFHDARSRSFHVAIARECDRLGWLGLSVMDLDGRAVSAHLVVVLDGVAYMMRSGRDTSLGKLSIGHLHDLKLFAHYINAGCTEVDFLRGAEPYKFYWTRHYRRYVECFAVRSGPLRGLSLSAARTWIWLSQFLSHRHPPGEVLAYIRQRRAISRELRRMGLRLR